MIGASIKGSLGNLKNSTYFKSFNDGFASTVGAVQVIKGTISLPGGLL